MQLSIRKFLFLIAVLCVIFSIAGVFYGIHTKRRNADAVWWVADMVVEHLGANDLSWPSNWDDLEDDHQTCVSRSGQAWQFEELKERVNVDLDAQNRRIDSTATKRETDVCCNLAERRDRYTLD